MGHPRFLRVLAMSGRQNLSAVGAGYSVKAAARPPHSTLAVGEPAGGLLGVVGEGEGGAGALDAGEDFEGDALFVEPAFGGGGFDHGVFATDVVGADGDIEFFADGADDVE